MVDYQKLKVSELKDLLKQRNLVTSGTKNELIARLENADSESSVAEDASKQSQTQPQPDVAAEVGTQQEELERRDLKGPGEPAAPTSNATNSDKQLAESGVNSQVEVTEANMKTEVAQKSKPKDEMSSKPPHLMTDEEIIADFGIRITRNKRFGVDTSELEVQLNRVKRFGGAAYRESLLAKEKLRQQAAVLKSDHARKRNRRNKHKKPAPIPAKQG